jgi:hypothetical protein
MRPGLQQAYGCGEPPSAALDDPQDRIELDETLGRRVSPVENVKRDLPAYRQLGFGGRVDKATGELTGGVRLDWPHCPRWFLEFSRATVGGGPVYETVSRAADLMEHGAASLLFRGQATKGMLDLLDAFRVLESWERERTAKKVRAEVKAEAEARRRSAKAGRG